MLGIPEKEKEYFSRDRRMKVREMCRLMEAWTIRRAIPSTIEMVHLEVQRAAQGI